MIGEDEGQVVLAVELCGRLADATGPRVEVAIPAPGCSVAELFAALSANHPALAAPIREGRVKACVDETIVGPAAHIRPDAAVALFPPVSGG